MLVLSHALVGGAVGQRIGIPFWAFLTGIILHIILDKIPHFWPKTKKHKAILMALDGAITLFVLLFFINKDVNNINSFLAGAFGGIIVDVLMIYTPLYKKKIGQWHTKRQIHKTNILFYISDLTVIFLSLLSIWWFK